MKNIHTLLDIIKKESHTWVMGLVSKEGILSLNKLSYYIHYLRYFAPLEV